MKYIIIASLLILFSCSDSKNNQNLYNDQVTKGKASFDKLCSNCHSIEKDTWIMGSPLYNITRKRTKKWLYAFTRSNSEMLENQDSIALEIFNRTYSVMGDFKNLSNSDLKNIYMYIESESNK